jgi:hypothetical protein
MPTARTSNTDTRLSAPGALEGVLSCETPSPPRRAPRSPPLCGQTRNPLRRGPERPLRWPGWEADEIPHGEDVGIGGPPWTLYGDTAVPSEGDASRFQVQVRARGVAPLRLHGIPELIADDPQVTAAPPGALSA